MLLGTTLNPLASKLPQVHKDFTASFPLHPPVTCPWHNRSLRSSEIVQVLLSHHHPQRHHLLRGTCSSVRARGLWQPKLGINKTCQHISSLYSTKNYMVKAGRELWQQSYRSAHTAHSPFLHQLGALSEKNSCISTASRPCDRVFDVEWG